MPIIKPMLASNIDDVNALNYPVIATPKVDGIRCLRIGDRALTRSWKPVPNAFIRETLERLLPENMDGELFANGNFQKTTSAIMTQKGEPEFVFCMFDFVPDGDISMPYTERLEAMVAWYRTTTDEQRKYIKVLPFTVINSVEELRAYEKKVLAEGHEGVMVRSPEGPYKCGRSSLKQGWLLKLKIFLDSEAEVLGFEEMMSNQNVATKDELGHTKRSGHKAGLVPANTLGKLNVRDLKTGVEFNIGTGDGLTLKLRKEIWDNRDDYLGKIVKYKYQPHGVKDKPRCPIAFVDGETEMLGFRDPRDMDAK